MSALKGLLKLIKLLSELLLKTIDQQLLTNQNCQSSVLWGVFFMVRSINWLQTFLNQMLTLPHCQLRLTKCLSFSAQFNVFCAFHRGRMKGGVSGVCSNPDHLFATRDRIKEPLSHLEEPSSRPEQKLSPWGRMSTSLLWFSLLLKFTGVRKARNLSFGIPGMLHRDTQCGTHDVSVALYFI